MEISGQNMLKVARSFKIQRNLFQIWMFETWKILKGGNLSILIAWLAENNEISNFNLSLNPFSSQNWIFNAQIASDIRLVLLFFKGGENEKLKCELTALRLSKNHHKHHRPFSNWNLASKIAS